MNQITPINIGPRPAHLPTGPDALAINQAAFANWQASFGVLSLRGGMWHVRQGGNETTVTASPGPNMAPIAVPVLPVVIVGVSTLSAKSYYAGGFNPEQSRPPDCFSIDGVEPDARAANKQNPTCAPCRHNMWGSAVNSPSGKGKACRDFKRIAVVRDLNDEPLMLQLPPTSVPNLQDYITRLTKLGTAANQVITVMAFEMTKGGAPKVTFEAQGWLDAAQYARAVDLGSSMSVHRMLEQEWGDGSDSSNEKAASAQMAATLGPRPAHLAAPSTMVEVAQKALAEKAPQATAPPAPQATAPPAPPAPTAFPPKPPVAQAQAPEPPVPPTPEPPVPPTPAPPTPEPPLPPAAAQVVQGAPADLQSAIDALLNLTTT